MALRFQWNGNDVEAHSGDSVAAALINSGHRTFGSTRTGEPRSLFCGMGICQECLVDIDGRPSQLACMTEVSDGMDVRLHDDRAPSTASVFSAAARPPQTSVDLAIIGGGPAGLTAALACANSGISVCIIDERSELGGQYFKPRSEGFHAKIQADEQHRKGDTIRSAVRQSGAELHLGETTWYGRRLPNGLFDLRTTSLNGMVRYEARAVILSTGAYELSPMVPGWTLPGVMAIGAAQTLARRYGVLPGRQIIIAGNGPLGFQLAAETLRLGGNVAAVVERATLRQPGALAAAVAASPSLIARGAIDLARLRARGVPILLGWELAGVLGSGGTEAAIVRRLSDGAERTISADTVCIGEGFAPQLEIGRLLGIRVEVEPRTGLPRPVRGEDGSTDVPGLWIVGDAGGLGGAHFAQAQGLLAGSAALKYLGKPAESPVEARTSLRHAASFQKALWHLFAAAPRTPPAGPTILCRCERISNATVSDAIRGGATSIGSLKRLTRLGMGRCQGRYCIPAATRLLIASGLAMSEADLAAPQIPVKPVGAGTFASEKAEWSGHAESITGPRPAIGRAEPLRRQSADLVVIGAGVVGISAAYFAARRGANVVVLERGRLYAEASGGNAGSLHLQLLSWDFGGKSVGGGNLQLQTLPLQQESIGLWRQIEKETGGDFELHITGGMMVAEDPTQIRFLEAKAKAEASVGVRTEIIGADRIRELAPSVSERMVAAAWCPGEGKINPLRASNALADAARASGASLEELTPVEHLGRSGSGYLIATPRGTISSPRVLIAAGGWSAQVGAMLGEVLPIRGAPLQMVVTEPTGPLFSCLLAHADRHLTMKQTSSSTVLIGGAWPGSTNPSGHSQVLPDSLEGNLYVAARTVPAVGGLRVVRSWAAMNIDIDGAPLLSELPRHPGVVVAATANGFTLGPLMGAEAVRIALDGRPRSDLAPFSLERFN